MKSNVIEILIIFALAVNSIFLGIEIAEIKYTFAFSYLVLIIILTIFAYYKKIYYRGVVFSILYFFFVGYIIGYLFYIYYFEPDIVKKLNSIYNAYFYIIILAMLYLPLYKFVIEKRTVKGKIIDKGEKYYIVNINSDIFSSIKSGIYAIEKSGVEKNVGDEIEITKDWKGKLKVKE